MNSMNLTPAESLMLLDPDRPDGKKLLKLTFADLLLNGVIKASVREETHMLFKRKRIYIRRDRIAPEFVIKPHERVILERIHGTERLDRLARSVFQSVGSLNKYAQDYVRRPLLERGYFKTEETKRLLVIRQTKYLLSDKGLEAQKRIEDLLKEGESLSTWVKDDPARARAYLSVCGPNVLLLEQYDLKAIEQWSREIAREETKTYHYYRDTWYGHHLRFGIFDLDDDHWHRSEESDHSGLGLKDLNQNQTEQDDTDLGFDFSNVDLDILDSFDSFSDLDSAFDSDLGQGADGDGGDGGDGGD